MELICFPPNEACTPERMIERINTAPEATIVAVDKTTNKLVGMINGIFTDEEIFKDDFFIDSSLHKPNGKNVMITGVEVLPGHRGIGLASILMKEYKQKLRRQGKSAAYLTCLEDKVNMYIKMGFTDLGISQSYWGGESWHEMVSPLNLKD